MLYTVYVNDQSLPLHDTRVSAYPINRRWPGHQRSVEQTEEAAFGIFAADTPVHIRVVPQRPFMSAVVRPLSREITPRIARDEVSFTLTAPGGYTVELDGCHHALHLFFNPVTSYGVAEGDPGVLYFGPGEHDVGLVHLQSHQTVYLHPDAVVYGCLHASNAQDIRILGHGILDNSRNRETILFAMEREGDGQADTKNAVREHTIQLIHCKRVRIDGITIHNSLLYNVAAFGCEDLDIANVKAIGCWRYNTDGIDLHNCVRCYVHDCFLRTFDDAICIKGHEPYRQDCGGTLVENCVIWCDWGMALEIGAETCARQIHNVTFRNCDIIRATQAAMDVQNVDYADVYDIVFDDIRVECDDICPTPLIQSRDDMGFAHDPGSTYVPKLMAAVIFKHPEHSVSVNQSRGRTHDLLFRNIHVTSRRMLPSHFRGYDEEHLCQDVKIDGLFLNGHRVTTLQDARIAPGPHAAGIRLG